MQNILRNGIQFFSKKSVKFSLLALFSGLHIGVQAAEPSSVTLSLEEYMKLVTKDLVKKPELPSLTVVEEALLSGEFGKSLKIRFSGSSIGERKASERLIDLNDNYSLTSCTGSAFLKAEGSSVSLFPRADKFSLECEIEVSKWQDLTLTAYNVLSLKSNVKGIKTRIQGQSGVQKTVYFEVPLTELQPVIGDISVVARFRIVVLPEAQNFTYNLELNNPNRGSKTFDFPLQNGESIRRVDFAGKWEEKKDHVIFQVEPGVKRVSIEGALGNKGFTSPFKEARQYLMIENHPNLQLDLKTNARRISASDAGLRESFASARTFQLNPADSLAWTARTLEIFFSPSLAINSANYRYHLPQEGHPMVQARFNVENRGVPELPLKVPGKPLYLEVAGRPQVLTKDADGNLLVQLPTGNQDFFVQYEAPPEVKGSVSGIRDELVKPAFLISNVSVGVGSGVARGLYFAKGLGDWQSAVNWNSLAYALVMFLITGFVFARTLPKNPRWALSLILATYIFVRPWNLSDALWALVLIWAIRNRSQILVVLQSIYKKFQVVDTWTWAQWKKIVAPALALFGLFILYNLAVPNFHRLQGRMMDKDSASSDAMNSPGAAAPAMLAREESSKKAMAVGGMAFGKSKEFDSRSRDSKQEVAEESLAQDMEGGFGWGMSADAPAENYATSPTGVGSDWQGLPAPISIPDSVEEYYFSQQLLKADQPILIGGFTVMKRWSNSLHWFLILLALGLIAGYRKDYREWIKG